MRLAVSASLLSVGIALGLGSYFGLAARLGSPIDEGFSNPTMTFAPTLFVIGILLVFVAPLVYELYPRDRA